MRATVLQGPPFVLLVSPSCQNGFKKKNMRSAGNPRPESGLRQISQLHKQIPASRPIPEARLFARLRLHGWIGLAC